MSHTIEHPPFGAADLTNCEREQIHLAGSIQPHGALLVLREPEFAVVQASTNTAEVLGIAHSELLGKRLSSFGGDLAEQVTRLAKSNLLMQATPIRCHIEHDGIAHSF